MDARISPPSAKSDGPLAELWRSARRFVFDFAGFARGDAIKGAVYTGLGAMVESAGLLLLVPILGVVFDGDAAGRTRPLFALTGIEGRLGKLALLLALFVASVIVRAIVLWRRDVTLAQLRVGFVAEQRQKLVGALAAASWAQLARIPHSRINHLLGSDLLLTGSCVYHALQCAVSFAFLIVFGALMVAFSPLLALIAVVMMSTGIAALLPQLVKSRALGNDVADANVRLAASGAHFLEGLKPAIGQNLQHRFASEFNDTLGKLMQRQVSLVREQSKTQLAFTTVSSLVGTAVILVGASILQIGPSALIVFVVTLARMSAPFVQIQQGAQQIASFLPSYEKIVGLQDELVRDGGEERTQALEIIPTGGVQFRGVSYSHGRGGVFDIDLTIDPGSFVGIAGPSGAGKTTFADLLVGIISPQRGDIYVGGKPMSPAMRRRWRSELAYLPQETFLFCDTIRANLIWACEDARETEIWSALRKVGAETLVVRMGLDAVVGDRGALLSGGERQRLALARALLRRPRLLILDEATNAIDVDGERAVLLNISGLEWHPSIVLIAHRNESLALCDRVLEFAAGRLISDLRRPRA